MEENNNQIINEEINELEKTKVLETEQVESLQIDSTNQNADNKKKKKNNIIKIIIFIILFVIGFIIGFTLSKDDKDKTKDKDKNNSNNTVEEEFVKDEEAEEKIIEQTEDKEAKKYLYVYKYKIDDGDIGYSLYDEEQKDDDYVLLDRIACYSDCTELTGNNLNFLIYDDEYMIYNVKNNELKKLNIKEKFEDNSIVEDSNGKLIGVVFNDKKSKYYSLKENKVTYETNLYISSEPTFIDKGYLILIDNKNIDDYDHCGTSELININTWKVLDNSKITDKIYSSDGSNNYINNGCVWMNDRDLLDDNFKPIFNKYYGEISVSNDKKTALAYNYEAKSYDIYDYQTKTITNKKVDYKIELITDKYIIVEKDNHIAVMDLSNNILNELTNETGMFETIPSGYYDAHDDKPEGLYLVFNGSDGEGDNYKENCYEYYYNEKTNEFKKYNLEFCGGYAKPVLYLYPTKKTDITVNFEHEDMLTTTYPKFNKEWKVTANPNGDLYDKDGNYYYALYWEENGNHKVDFSTGFYVEKENAIKFLEEKLEYIGLSKKERNEFIMYWLPILEKNQKSLVYFELTQERDLYNKLIINPKPDSLLRIAIHIKKVDKKTNIKEQKLTKFERKGFTAVEWGGVNYN